MRIAAAFAFTVFAIITTPAGAATVESLFQEFGLFGNWAFDCSQPPSLTANNTHASFTKRSDGVVVEDMNPGPGLDVSHYTILSAERLSDTQLSMEAIFQPGTAYEQRFSQVLLISNATWRQMFSKMGDRVGVKDGIVVFPPNGRPTPVWNKCK